VVVVVVVVAVVVIVVIVVVVVVLRSYRKSPQVFLFVEFRACVYATLFSPNDK